MERITKEQAIDLWYKFVNSFRVSNNQDVIGMTYCYYELQLKDKGVLIEEVRLLCPFMMRPHEPIPADTAYKALETPYGNFELTVEELQPLYESWRDRTNKKGTLPINELIQVL